MCFRPPSFGEMMKTCTACGAFNPPALQRCKKCGAELPESEAEAPQGSPPAIGAPTGASPGPKGPGMAPKGPGMAPKSPGAPKPPTP